MISARGWLSGDGAGTARVWVSIVWMASVVNFSAGQTAQLVAAPRVETICGQNVTMTCDVNIRDTGGIKLFQWIAKNWTCQHGQDHADTKIACRSEEKRLSLTVLNVMPGDQGDYLCKLRSETGAKATKTVLVTSDCSDIPVLQVNESQAHCCFTGVYPRGTIHWFQGGVNLTDSAVQLPDVEDKDGRYDVCSTLPAAKGDLKQSYNCSLSQGSYKFSTRGQYKPREENVLGAAASSSASLPVVLIMAATATKVVFKEVVIG